MNIARKAAAVFLACLTLFLPLTAHAENGAALRASAFESVNTVKGLTLTTDQSIYSPYSLALTLRFQNKTRRDYGYGAQYYLEKYMDGQWYTFVDPDNVAYPAIGYYLAAKGSAEHTLTITDSAGFHRFYAQIEPGTYRIVQPLRDEQTKETVYLAAEFRLTAQPPAEDTFLYAKEPVNLRLGPSTEYWVLRELTLGERVSFIRKSGKWTLVRAGEQTGYVYGKYLVKDERDCYYNHFAMKALRAAGVKDARVTGVYAVDPSSVYDERGVSYGCGRCVSIEWTRPYAYIAANAITILIYADDVSAQKKFSEIASAQIIIPDADISYFYGGRYIIRWRAGGLSEFDASRRERNFCDKLEKALRQASQDHIGYNRTLDQK